MVIRKDFEVKKVEPKKKKHEVLDAAKDEIKKSFSWGFFGKTIVLLFGVGALFFFAAQSGDFLQKWMTMFIQNKIISRLTERETPIAQEKSQEIISGNVIPQKQGEKTVIPTPEKNQPFFRILPPSEIDGKENIIYSSFSDLFSGVGWIDQEKTTMYHDRVATAYTFAPKFKWERRFSSSFDENQLIAIDENGTDTRCLRGLCLSQNGNKLTFNGAGISLPEEMKGKNIVNVSVGALSSRWVVGIVVSSRGQYEGWVFSYDGTKYTKVFGEANAPFISQYQGIIGFGGTDDDWIALYGGYGGIAYRIRSGKAAKDISQFFGYRVMGEGFHPVILRSDDDGTVRWYIFSLTDGSPHLMKLFQSTENQEIEGILDFAPRIFIGSFSKASFKVIASSEQSAVLGGLLTMKEGTREIWELTDEGFSYPSAAEVVSINLNNYPAQVRSATIMESDLYADGNDVSYYVSNNGEDWISAEPSREIGFPDKSGTRLLWRVRFSPTSRTHMSPFFDKIRIDYKVRFL